jgi:hypothetical protein
MRATGSSRSSGPLVITGAARSQASSGRGVRLVALGLLLAVMALWATASEAAHPCFAELTRASEQVRRARAGIQRLDDPGMAGVRARATTATDDMLALFLKLNLQDPNNDPTIHSRLHDLLQQTRELELEVTRSVGTRVPKAVNDLLIALESFEQALQRAVTARVPGPGPDGRTQSASCPLPPPATPSR